MKALKCDNCGEYYDYTVSATTKIAFCRDNGAVVSEKDLCPECLAAVTTTLEDRAKIKIQKKTDPLEDDLKRYLRKIYTFFNGKEVDRVAGIFHVWRSSDPP